jgi:hypothetical protein
MLASNEDSKLTFTVFHNNNHGVIWKDGKNIVH